MLFLGRHQQMSICLRQGNDIEQSIDNIQVQLGEFASDQEMTKGGGGWAGSPIPIDGVLINPSLPSPEEDFADVVHLPTSDQEPEKQRELTNLKCCVKAH